MIIDILLIIIILFIVFKLEAKTFPYASIIFILLYIIYIYSGTIMMNYDEFIVKDEYFFKLQFMVRGGFVVIIVAYITSYYTFKRVPLILKESNELSYAKKNAFLFVSIVVIVISLFYLVIIPVNPLIVMIHDPSGLGIAREQATTTLKHFGFYNNFISFFLPLVWLTLLFMNNKKYIVLFLLNFIVLMSTGQKSPIVYLLFLLLIAVSLRNKKFNYRKSTLLLLFMLLFLVIIVVFQNWHLLHGLSFESLELAWNGLKRRIFYGGVLPLKEYLEFFPQYMNHYYFTSPQTPPDQLVYAYSYPNTGIVGTVNSVSLANMYAAFGSFYIVFTGFFFLSFVFFISEKMIFNYMTTPIGYALYTLCSLIAVKLVITDWYSIIPQYIVLSFSFLGALFFLEAFLYYFTSSRKKFLVKNENLYFVAFSLMMFAYFFQGQIRGLLHG